MLNWNGEISFMATVTHAVFVCFVSRVYVLMSSPYSCVDACVQTGRTAMCSTSYSGVIRFCFVRLHCFFVILLLVWCQCGRCRR
jgi:hypothetical protein